MFLSNKPNQMPFCQLKLVHVYYRLQFELEIIGLRVNYLWLHAENKQISHVYLI